MISLQQTVIIMRENQLDKEGRRLKKLLLECPLQGDRDTTFAATLIYIIEKLNKL